MTGPEHFREAEQWAAIAARAFARDQYTVASTAAALAQAHATAAVAAATTTRPARFGVRRDELKAWAHAFAVRPAIDKVGELV